jgi:NDP-sugar pyrophosphorylase family protein
MKAMILAAGLGTRLRPLTNDRPKALVEINGRTMLEITLSRLRSFGVRDVIINAFHFSEMIGEYLSTNNYFGMNIEVSVEDLLLDTGGGLKKASYFFQNEAEPFIVHNVDVLSAIDLKDMSKYHTKNQALATLAMQDRKTSRYLLFDNKLQLCGRRSSEKEPELAGNTQPAHALAFSGIHVISPRLLAMLSEEGAFSIITSYLRLAAQHQKILAYRADDYYWRDLGTPKNIAEAAADLKRGQPY